MNILRLSLGLCMSLVINCVAYAEIVEIHAFKDIEEVIAPLTNSDWVLFDIDYTLTEPENAVLQMAVIKQNKQRFLDELAKFNEEQRHLVPALMVTQGLNKLTDPYAPLLIQKLQNQHVTVMGFTAIDTSTIPDVGVVPLWRSRELKRLGIDFNSDSLPQEWIEFPQFKPFRGTYPLYQEGILYSNVLPSKGEVLSAFLCEVDRKPGRVIFIDDSIDNLKNVETEMKKKAIPFLGIHYRIQVDEKNAPQVSDEEWKIVWNKIHERAERALTSPEGILETHYPLAIQWGCQSMPDNALIIFDVGNVLLMHKDTVLHSIYRPWIKEWFEREAPEVDRKTIRDLVGVVNREAEMTLVDDSFPSIIKNSKAQSTVIALSKLPCDSMGENVSFENQPLNTLKKFEIYLEEPFPEATGWQLENLKTTYAEGLIQTEASLKGPVLKAFLDHLGWKPKAILFIDDSKEQCVSIANTAKELHIPALCIRYTGALENTRPLNQAIANLQMQTLVDEKHWINDEAAQHQLLKSLLNQ